MALMSPFLFFFVSESDFTISVLSLDNFRTPLTESWILFTVDLRKFFMGLFVMEAIHDYSLDK